MLVWNGIPGHGNGLYCCYYYCCCCCWLQHRVQAEHWVAPQDSLALERAECPGAVVLGDGHGGWSGERCCGCGRGCGRGCGCAESHWSAERTTPASSLNGSGSRTGDQGRALHMGSAADSRMGVWAWPCLHFLLLYLTNRVCCHLVRVIYMIRKNIGWKIRKNEGAL